MKKALDIFLMLLIISANCRITLNVILPKMLLRFFYYTIQSNLICVVTFGVLLFLTLGGKLKKASVIT